MLTVMKQIKNKEYQQNFIANSSTRYKNEEVIKLNNKELPELYTKREDCCGCTACYSVCPKDAITMKADEEGFIYPVVDTSKCIRCYKCIKICVFKEAKKEKCYL